MNYVYIYFSFVYHNSYLPITGLLVYYSIKCYQWPTEFLNYSMKCTLAFSIWALPIIRIIRIALMKHPEQSSDYFSLFSNNLILGLWYQAKLKLCEESEGSVIGFDVVDKTGKWLRLSYSMWQSNMKASDQASVEKRTLCSWLFYWGTLKRFFILWLCSSNQRIRGKKAFSFSFFFLPQL